MLGHTQRMQDEEIFIQDIDFHCRDEFSLRTELQLHNKPYITWFLFRKHSHDLRLERQYICPGCHAMVENNRTSGAAHIHIFNIHVHRVLKLYPVNIF